MSEHPVRVGLVEDHLLMGVGVENLLCKTGAVNYVGGYASVQALLNTTNASLPSPSHTSSLPSDRIFLPLLYRPVFRLR